MGVSKIPPSLYGGLWPEKPGSIPWEGGLETEVTQGPGPSSWLLSQTSRVASRGLLLSEMVGPPGHRRPPPSGPCSWQQSLGQHPHCLPSPPPPLLYLWGRTKGLPSRERGGGVRNGLWCPWRSEAGGAQSLGSQSQRSLLDHSQVTLGQ